MKPNQTTSIPHPEILHVGADVQTISCNGGGGALGHPKVYYTFHDQDEVTCGYCDRLFTKNNVAGAKPYRRDA
jgi:uncharacterized Zn-finger protein